MLIKNIMDNDLDNCEAALKGDTVLYNREENLKNLISQLSQEDIEKADDMISSIEERVIRIAYLQGLKDMYHFMNVLKMDTREILDSYLTL